MANANIGALMLNQQNVISPAINAGTLGIALGVASTQVLAANAQVRKLTFHNPGDVAVFVCQATDANGNALVAGPNPGNWKILPGGLLEFTGNGVAGAWLAAAESGAGNPFTVGISQTL